MKRKGAAMVNDANTMEALCVSSDSPQIEQKPRLLDQVRNIVRCKHYSLRTEQGYIQWIKRYIFFHGKQHPDDLNEAHVSAFLTHLAVDLDVASSTQNQALCALVFLYRDVLQKEIGDFKDLIRAKRIA